MKKSHLAFTIFCFSISIFADPKASIVERKKAFDSRSKFLVGMQEIITSEKLVKEFQGLKEAMNEVDTTYRTGEKDKIKKTLTSSEVKLATFQKEYATFISKETKELMESYSSQVTSAEEKNAEKSTKPTLTETAIKEKSSSYYTIAKADYANAVKFERDGNLQYAIQLYKRALMYTVFAFDNAKYPLPAKFASLSKKVSTEPDSNVSTIGGTHTAPAKEGKEAREIKPVKSGK